MASAGVSLILVGYPCHEKALHSSWISRGQSMINSSIVEDSDFWQSAFSVSDCGCQFGFISVQVQTVDRQTRTASTCFRSAL